MARATIKLELELAEDCPWIQPGSKAPFGLAALLGVRVIHYEVIAFRRDEEQLFARNGFTELRAIEWFQARGLVAHADEWLLKNPPPKEWTHGRYSWAYTDAPARLWTSSNAELELAQAREARARVLRSNP